MEVLNVFSNMFYGVCMNCENRFTMTSCGFKLIYGCFSRICLECNRGLTCFVFSRNKVFPCSFKSNNGFDVLQNMLQEENTMKNNVTRNGRKKNKCMNKDYTQRRTHEERTHEE